MLFSMAEFSFLFPFSVEAELMAGESAVEKDIKTEVGNCIKGIAIPVSFP